MDHPPASRAEVRQAMTVSTHCRACSSATDMMHTEDGAVYVRHWFRCQKCRRWWAITITVLGKSHGPFDVPNRLKENR